MWLKTILMLSLPSLFWLIPHVSPAIQCSNIQINEVDYDQPSTDTEEYVELRGLPNFALEGYELRFINGSTSAPYAVQPLTGTVPADGYFVVGSNNVANLDQSLGAGGSNLIQNGTPDGIGLWETSADLLCDFVNYEGTITGFESWPDIGTDSASLCGTGASTSLARREVTPPGGEWVMDACGTPGEANLGPTALTLISFHAQSTDQFPRLKVFLAGLVGVVLWSIYWMALSRQSIPK
jgi:hypothetical protein